MTDANLDPSSIPAFWNGAENSYGLGGGPMHQLDVLQSLNQFIGGAGLIPASTTSAAAAAAVGSTPPVPPPCPPPCPPVGAASTHGTLPRLEELATLLAQIPPSQHHTFLPATELAQSTGSSIFGGLSPASGSECALGHGGVESSVPPDSARAMHLPLRRACSYFEPHYDRQSSMLGWLGLHGSHSSTVAATVAPPLRQRFYSAATEKSPPRGLPHYLPHYPESTWYGGNSPTYSEQPTPSHSITSTASSLGMSPDPMYHNSQSSVHTTPRNQRSVVDPPPGHPSNLPLTPRRKTGSCNHNAPSSNPTSPRPHSAHRHHNNHHRQETSCPLPPADFSSNCPRSVVPDPCHGTPDASHTSSLIAILSSLRTSLAHSVIRLDNAISHLTAHNYSHNTYSNGLKTPVQTPAGCRGVHERPVVPGKSQFVNFETRKGEDVANLRDPLLASPAGEDISDDMASAKMELWRDAIGIIDTHVKSAESTNSANGGKTDGESCSAAGAAPEAPGVASCASAKLLECFSILPLPAGDEEPANDHAAAHAEGRCQPCAFYYSKRKLCRNGDLCPFCHHEDHARSTPKKWKRQNRPPPPAVPVGPQ